MIRTNRKTFLGLTLAVTLLWVVPLATAQKKTPDATVTMKTTSVAFIAGGQWGSGTLSYQGQDYPISVGGLKAGSIGIKGGTMSGNVYNLKKLEDIEGTYVAGEASATLAGGAGAASMRNDNGVVLNIMEMSKGLDLTIAAKGMTIKLKK